MQGLRAVPRGVVALGFVSLFMDVSSEMIHALLPVYLVTVLGASTAAVGWIEGIAEATASVAKLFSGALSDALGRRKLLAALGYGLSALTKPMFPLATSLGWVVTARFVDRIGKGVRGAPRDALVADLTPPGARGASFGLRQALDSVGALLGPLVAVAAMALTGGAFRSVFWIAVLPAALAVLLLLLGVEERRVAGSGRLRPPLHWRELSALGRPTWTVVAVAGVFTLARMSEAFLILRASSVGVPAALVPMVLVLMNAAYALSSYPAGALGDVMERRSLLGLGFAALGVADLVLGAATQPWHVGAGVLLFGLHMGMTQGLFAAMLADAAPESLRGTAFGVFQLVSGLALLVASVIAGALWDRFGAPAPFFVAAAVIAAGLLASLALRPERKAPAA